MSDRLQPAKWSLVSAVLSAVSLLIGLGIASGTQHIFNFVVPLFASVLFLLVSFGLGIFALVRSARNGSAGQISRWLIWALVVAFLTLIAVLYWWPLGV